MGVGSHCTAHKGLWERFCFQLSKGSWDTSVGSATLPFPSFPQLSLSPSHPKHTRSTMPRGEQSPASNRASPGLCLFRDGGGGLGPHDSSHSQQQRDGASPQVQFMAPSKFCQTHDCQVHQEWAWSEHDLRLGLPCLPPYCFSRQNHT